MKSSVIFIFLSVITSQGRCSPQQSGRTSNIQLNIGECREGSAWSQACNTCICLNGGSICTANVCGNVDTPRPTTTPAPRPTITPTSRPTTTCSYTFTTTPSLRPTSAPTQPPTPRPTSRPTTRSTQPPTPRPTSYPTARPATTSTISGIVLPSVAVSGLALWEAARAGDLSAVVAQLAAGADVNWGNQGEATALHAAARYNHPDVVNVLLDAGATGINTGGQTPIYWASYFGSSSALGILISRGGDVNLPGSGGITPLHGAALNNQAGSVQQLLAAGADTTARTNGGDTPGDWARCFGHPNLGATIDNYSP